jgi:hypothetical protein
MHSTTRRRGAKTSSTFPAYPRQLDSWQLHALVRLR